jgi:hypothetical protein
MGIIAGAAGESLQDLSNQNGINADVDDIPF